MNTSLGYAKRTLTDTNVLLSGGGDKPLSDFIGSISWDATSRKIKYTPVGGSAINLVTFGSLALLSSLDSYSLHEAYLLWGGKNFSGEYGPIDAAMVSELGACRTMFLDAAGVVVEYSTDAGATWTDYGATDALKVGLFSSGANFIIGKNAATSANNMLRVTMRTKIGHVYTVLNKFVIYVSTLGSVGTYCTIRCRTLSNYENGVDTWVTLADHTPISGWGGYNVINVANTRTYGTNKNSQYGEWQFIFGCTGHDSNYASAAGLAVNKIFGFGGIGWTAPSNMAKTGHLYSYDSSLNATFPANINVSGGIKRVYNEASDSPMLSLESNNQDVWLWRIKDYGTGVTTDTSKVYGFGLKYLGTGNYNDNDLILYSDNQTGTQVAAMTVKLDGTTTFSKNITAASIIKSGGTSAQFLKADGSVDSSTYLTASSVTDSTTSALGTSNTTIATIGGVNITAKVDHVSSGITAGTAGTSSATSGSSVSVPYVTVNAAGHVTGYGTHTHTISGFATSGHNHDSDYVNISGDLMTGNLRRKLSDYTRGTAPSTRLVAAYPFVDANNVTSGWIEYDASPDGQTSIGMYVVTPRSSSNNSNIWTGFKVIKPATTWYGLYTMNYNVANGQLTVPAPSGTAPFVISSNEVVTNLNADLLDGNHASAFATSGHNHEIQNLTNFSSRVYDATISRTKNTVLAAPNGSNGVASFRALVAADIPTLTMSKISDAPSTKALTVNGTAYNVYTSSTSLPTILAPTSYGTANLILATNANANGLTWVAKPTSNVSTAAYVASSSTGKAQITAAQSDPYYNLVEGSTVNRSIQFKAGTGMSISSSTGGVITFTNSTASTLNTISSYLAVTVSGDVVTFPVFDSDGNFAGWENSEISIQSGSFYKTTLNNTECGDPLGTSLGSWYAPTSGGTSGQVLKSAGSTSTPEWKDPGSFIAELYVPRVTESVNNVPNLNRFRVREHTAGTTYNLPTNNSYHIYTTVGFSNTLATELAIPMTDTAALYVRSKTSSVWRPWVRLLDGDPVSMTGTYLLDKSDLFTTTNFYPGNRLYGLPGANITINPGSGSDSTIYSSTSLGTDDLKKLMTMSDYSFRFANKTPSSTTTIALYDGLLIIIDVGDFSNANSLIYGTIRAIYVFGANCGHGCNLTIDTQACNSSTWINIVNSQLKGWAGPNIYWIDPFIIGGYTGLTSRVRKIRIRSYVNTINSSYTKEIPRIGGLGLIGDKPYIAPSNIAINNHLYTVSLDMTGVFPSYVQSTGFKVAGKNDTYVLLAGGGTAALSSIGGGGGSVTTTSTSFNSSTTLKILFYTDPTNGGNISTVHYNTNFYVNSSGVFYSSDRNLKTNIKDYSTSIKDNPIKLFDWKDGTGKNNIGFIAQELEEWCPQAVGTNEDGRKTVNYKTALSALCSFLYNKIKDLEAKLSKLEKEKA